MKYPRTFGNKNIDDIFPNDIIYSKNEENIADENKTNQFIYITLQIKEWESDFLELDLIFKIHLNWIEVKNFRSIVKLKIQKFYGSIFTIFQTLKIPKQFFKWTQNVQQLFQNC